MRIWRRRIFSGLIALTLALTAMAGISPVAFAAADGEGEALPAGEPFRPADGYVLLFGAGSGVDDYAYFSPFVPKVTYNGRSYNGYSILFGLKNTESGEIFENAYCTDLPVDAVDANYQRLNLTDSTYAAAHADKLRAILLGSYPHRTLAELAADSGIAGLRMCEAITGTQLAVWKAAHGDVIEITDFMSWLYASPSGHWDQIQPEYDDYRNGTDEYKAGVKARIQVLYDYLMALPERSASSRVVSEASVVSRSTKPVLLDNGDGTCDVTVTAVVDVPAGSDVTLTAYVGEGYWYAQKKLSVGRNECTLTIENVPAEYASDAVTLSIDGAQTVGEDVFLLDAEGIRGASQSMIAAMSGSLSVHAEVKAEPDRVLEIRKSGGGSPLANISFELYYVGSVEDYQDGALGIGSVPTAADIEKYAKNELLVGTITTDSSGYGALNLSTEDGVYLVRELPNKLVTDSVAFFVSLPDNTRLDENGDPAYTVAAAPKNTVRTEKVEIEKDVAALDCEHGSFAVGEAHTWIIQASIPEGIASAQKYEISDTLDERLSLLRVERVALARDGGTFGDSEAAGYIADEDETALGAETLVLRENVDYTAVVSRTADGKRDSCTVALTAAGMAAVAKATAGEPGDWELRVSLAACINSAADLGASIPNQAHAEYVNQLGKKYEADSDRPEVHTGGARILKESDSGAPLSGAVFEVYRMASEAETAAGGWTEVVVNGTVHKMMPVAFYAASDLSGAKVTEVTTGADGCGWICGLAYGDYYLVETKAPTGYDQLREAVKFTVDATSHLEERQITVINTSGTRLPETGGVGTELFTVGGLCLAAVACLLLVFEKGRRRQS